MALACTQPAAPLAVHVCVEGRWHGGGLTNEPLPRCSRPVQAWSDVAVFHVAPSAKQIGNASWVGDDSVNLVRAGFSLKEAPAKATLYVCGLGYSAASVNGQPASAQLLTTAPWTNNERGNAFSTMDVTSLVKAGGNVVGVALGKGWRDLTKCPRNDPEDRQGDATMQVLWLELHVLDSKGVESIALSTRTGAWAGAQGPVVFDSVYDGETYNANMELPGWDTPAFNAASWKKLAPLADAPRGLLRPWSSAPVALDRVIKPVGITKTANGKSFVVDFGVNAAGVVKLSNIKLAKGMNVSMTHGEIMQHELLPDLHGNVDTTDIYVGNLRSAKATDVYVAKGDAAGESYMPSFTYHGFRFVRVTGLASLSPGDIEMHHFHSANAMRSNVTFPKSVVLNTLQTMAVGAQRSNQMTVQTDCDQRDERLGWMGDIGLSADSIALNFKSTAFLESYMQTINDELNADGSSVDVAPLVRYGGRPGDISWQAAYVAVPYALYKTGGDTDAAKEYMGGMLKLISYVSGQCKGKAGKTCPTKYGDWVPPNPPGKGQGPKPSKPYTSSFSFVDIVAKVGEMAVALGNATVAAKMEALRAELVDSFNADYFAAANGTYDNGVMTTFTLALHLGLVPAASKAAVQKNLLNQVTTTFNDHNMCGIIGMKFLFEQLAAMGREDVALSVLEKTDYPSLGFMAYNKYEKATENTWELWDAYTEGTGMNSRNHHMFSSYSTYLVQHSGIAQAETSAGHKKLTLTPAKTRGLSQARVTSEFNNGKVSLEWERSGGVQCAKVPENTTLQLGCGSKGGVIEHVRFASWGKPHGTCGSFGVDVSCHRSVVEQLESQCLGKPACTAITASTGELGRPCAPPGTGAPLALYVEVECSAPQDISGQVTVPLGTTADLVLPAAGFSRPALRVTGSPATTTAVDGNGRRTFNTALRSGVHDFSLQAMEKPVVVSASAAGASVDVACPGTSRVSYVRFASFGNPAPSPDAGNVWLRGTCHLGSAVADAELACLGQPSCTVRVDRAAIPRGAATACFAGAATLAVEVECVAAADLVLE